MFVKIKNTKIDILIEMVCLLLLGGITLYLIWNWSSIPDKIPMHYDIAGQVDRWGNKIELLFLPILSWGMYILITVAEAFPKAWNTGVRVTEENAHRVYRILKSMIKITKLIVIAMFSYMTICSAVAKNLSSWFFVVTMFVVFGNIIFWTVKLFQNQ